MKEILGYIIGAVLLAFSWLFTWIKIGNLKAKNKKLETEKEWQINATESKVKEQKELNEIDNKSDEEILKGWNSK